MVIEKEYVTRDEIRRIVSGAIEEADESQRAFCKRINCKTPHLSIFLHERGAVPKPVLNWLGLERVIVYRKKK